MVAIPLASAVAALLIVSPPSGWRAHPGPDTGFTGSRVCANHSRQTWAVALVKGELRITQGGSSPALGPSRARLAGGNLLGVDVGEFGGGLFWYPDSGKTPEPIGPDEIRLADATVWIDGAERAKWARAGQRRRVQLSDRNVLAVFALPAEREALVFMGLAHMGSHYSEVFLAAASEGMVSLRKIADLGYPPTVIHAEADGSYLVLRNDGLLRLTSSGLVTPLCAVDLSSLHARSLVVVPDGDVWIGMSHFVARLRLLDSVSCAVEWFVPEECPSFESRGLTCVCVPS